MSSDAPHAQEVSSYEHIRTIRTELEAAVQLAKCRKCGCMHQTLDSLASPLLFVDSDEARTLAQRIQGWTAQMEPVRYACLGCDRCYAATAQNVLSGAFPSVSESPAPACGFQVNHGSWPPVAGEYFVVDEAASVAVSTLASPQLAERLAGLKPGGLAIVGKTETENIGIDKVIKNLVTNPAIRYLIVAGQDSSGHQSGRTMLALSASGIDTKRRVIGSPGRHPVLRNVSSDEIGAFRQQVQVIDMIGCDSPEEIAARVERLSREADVSCGCAECRDKPVPMSVLRVPVIVATEPGRLPKMDRAGYFVIMPLAGRRVINVEHYAYDNTLLHVVEGADARTLYATIIANGWVTELSHAAYLGKELARAELSLTHGFRYVQDGA